MIGTRALAALLLALALGAAHGAELNPSPPAAQPQAGLPAAVRLALEQAHVGEANRAFVVLPLDGGALQLTQQAQTPLNPASTMKLLTTYAALSLLGPNFRWHTAVLAHAPPHGGRLDGDLIVRGGGDPSLVLERWWLLLQRLRAQGLRDIRGNLVLDRSRYAAAPEPAGSLDGNELRPYNVAPDALLINYKSVAFTFGAPAAGALAPVAVLPPLEGMHAPATVRLVDGPCGDWKGRLQADFSQPLAPRFHGAFARACGEKTWYVSLLAPDDYALAAFGALWRASGGSFKGGVRSGTARRDDVLLAELESPPLAEVIRDINKNSNNVMARQLFLTLGEAPAAEAPEPDSAARAIRQVQSWLQQQDLTMPELMLENGSGLSRQERISAGSLARLLAHAWHSNAMPDFLASLPLAGVDGTMKERTSAAGAAYVKTGTLAEVRALAGYVFAASGHRYVVVALINDPHAEAAQAAHDAFLQWVWREG